MKKPNGKEIIDFLVSLLAEQEGVTISYITKAVNE